MINRVSPTILSQNKMSTAFKTTFGVFLILYFYRPVTLQNKEH